MRLLVAAFGTVVFLAGCQSLAISMAGAGATAALENDIVAQTQKMLEARPATASVPGPNRVNSFD